MRTTPTARAIVIDRPGEHRLVSGPPAEPGPGAVRVAVHAAGLCAGDREVFDGIRPSPLVRYPVTPGHEWAGIVDAVGEGVDPAWLGRPTVAESIRSCMVCERCREGLTSLCQAGYDEAGFTRPGGLADAVVVPVRSLHPLPDGTDLRAAALLAPAAVGADAVLSAEPRPGERVAVVGAGTLALLVVQLVAGYSPSELVVMGARQRAGLALTMGATDVRSPHDSAGLRGHFDVVLETAGAPGSADDACRLARRGGRVVLTGLPAAAGRGIDPLRLVRDRLVVRSVFGARPAAWSHAVRALATGLLDPAPLITHELPLTGFAQALDLLTGPDPQAVKVLLRVRD